MTPDELLHSLLSSEVCFFLNMEKARSMLCRKCEVLNNNPAAVLSSLFDQMSEVQSNEQVLSHPLMAETLKTSRSACVLSAVDYHQFCFVLNRCSSFRNQSVNKIEFVNFFRPLQLQDELGLLRVQDKLLALDERKAIKQASELFTRIDGRKGPELFSEFFNAGPIVLSELRRKKEEAGPKGSHPIGRMVVGGRVEMKESAVDSYIPTAYPSKVVLQPSVVYQEQGDALKDDEYRRVLRNPSEIEGKFQGSSHLT